MATGTVKWFNMSKGYGFIAPDEGADDVFVHISALKAAGIPALDEDDKVAFEMEEGPQGRTVAIELKRLG